MPLLGRQSALGPVLDLLDRSRAALLEAYHAGTTNDRYITAHLAALRAAAALLAARSTETGRRPRTTPNVWSGVAAIAPEFVEWTAYFALCGNRRRALESGQGYATGREADDLLRASETFLGLIHAALGLPVGDLHSSLSVVGRR